MKQTGLYLHTDEEINGCIEDFGYCWEEYGIYNGKHLVTRAEFDDGAAVINGELVDFDSETELRIRYLTPYNLVIAPVHSPINNNSFEAPFEKIMHKMLNKQASIEQLAEEILRLPKRVY